MRLQILSQLPYQLPNALVLDCNSNCNVFPVLDRIDTVDLYGVIEALSDQHQKAARFQLREVKRLEGGKKPGFERANGARVAGAK